MNHRAILWAVYCAKLPTVRGVVCPASAPGVVDENLKRLEDRLGLSIQQSFCKPVVPLGKVCHRIRQEGPVLADDSHVQLSLKCEYEDVVEVDDVAVLPVPDRHLGYRRTVKVASAQRKDEDAPMPGRDMVPGGVGVGTEERTPSRPSRRADAIDPEQTVLEVWMVRKLESAPDVRRSQFWTEGAAEKGERMLLVFCPHNPPIEAPPASVFEGAAQAARQGVGEPEDDTCPVAEVVDDGPNEPVRPR